MISHKKVVEQTAKLIKEMLYEQKSNKQKKTTRKENAEEPGEDTHTKRVEDNR
ncbi:MAG: hypothetical protein KAH01_07655 [Caldisericia bacterium]|nr:hypothetical protein [Caldisericia bacterium]